MIEGQILIITKTILRNKVGEQTWNYTQATEASVAPGLGLGAPLKVTK